LSDLLPFQKFKISNQPSYPGQCDEIINITYQLRIVTNDKIINTLSKGSNYLEARTYRIL